MRRVKVSEELAARLMRRAARSGRSMEVEHRLILEEALLPERRPRRKLLDVLQAGPFAEPDFSLERARDRGRLSAGPSSARSTACLM
jgi:plasmid stability protein